MESDVVTTDKTLNTPNGTVSGRGVESRFYLITALALIALVAVSFAPTLYLRPLFDARDSSGSPGLPIHLVVHGFALSLWFVLLLIQVLLVRSNRRDIHRNLGVAGVVIALVVVATSVLTTVRAVPRFSAAGVDPGLQAIVVSGDAIAVLTFAAFLVVAVVRRNSAATHKRLMLLASFAIVAPGIFGGDRPITLLQPYVPVPLPVIFLLGTLGSMVVHDVLTRRRLESATKWGIAVNLSTVVAMGGMLASGAANKLVHWLASIQ